MQHQIIEKAILKASESHADLDVSAVSEVLFDSAVLYSVSLLKAGSADIEVQNVFDGPAPSENVSFRIPGYLKLKSEC